MLAKSTDVHADESWKRSVSSPGPSSLNAVRPKDAGPRLAGGPMPDLPIPGLAPIRGPDRSPGRGH
jgi:hypothetical protein